MSSGHLVTVEFYGIARARAGIPQLVVPPGTLAEILAAIGASIPNWAETCLENGWLRPEFQANRNGEKFLANPAEPLRAGDSLLILSADSGG